MVRVSLRPSRGLIAFLAGIASVYAGRYVIDRTQIADRVVAPLLVSDTPASSDAIVVLGAGVTGSCAPNLNSLRRIMLAADAYRSHPRPILVAGGPSGGAPCAVARSMAQVARQLGVPERDLVIEASSRSTRENAERSAPILRAIGAQRLLLITDRLHLTRAIASFRQYGFTVGALGVPVPDGHVSNSDMLAAGLREYAALAYYRWKQWIEQPPLEHDELLTSVPTGAANAGDVTHPDGPIIVLGASYAAAWTPTIPGLTILNRGVAGQQSSEMLARFDTDVVAAKPRAVILWGFINDIFRSPRASIDETVARAQQNYLTMIERARRAGIDVVLATEVTVRAPKSLLEPVMSLAGRLLNRPNYQDYVNTHVLQVNAWLRALAARERLLLLDLQPVLSDRDHRRAKRFALDDGSHISAAGYGLLSESFGPVLARRFEPASSPSLAAVPTR